MQSWSSIIFRHTHTLSRKKTIARLIQDEHGDNPEGTQILSSCACTGTRRPSEGGPLINMHNMGGDHDGTCLCVCVRARVHVRACVCVCVACCVCVCACCVSLQRFTMMLLLPCFCMHASGGTHTSHNAGAGSFLNARWLNQRNLLLLLLNNSSPLLSYSGVPGLPTSSNPFENAGPR